MTTGITSEVVRRIDLRKADRTACRRRSDVNREWSGFMRSLRLIWPWPSRLGFVWEFRSENCVANRTLKTADFVSGDLTTNKLEAARKARESLGTKEPPLL